MSARPRKPTAAHPAAPVGCRRTLAAGAALYRLLAAVGTPQKAFGVVVCPGCRWPKGVELATKSSRCPRCGKSLAVARLKVWAEVAEAAQLPEAVGEVATGLRRGPAEALEAEAPPGSRQRPRARTLHLPESDQPDGAGRREENQSTMDPVSLAVRAATRSGAHSRWERVTVVVRELGRLQGEFTTRELAKALRRLGVFGTGQGAGAGAENGTDEALQRWVGRLLEAGLVYSPRPGFYQLV